MDIETAPAFSTATADRAALVLSYDKVLDHTRPPPPSAFTVAADSQPVAVTGVTVDAGGTTVTLTLDTAVTFGQAVSVAYTDPTDGDDDNAIQDDAGRDAASLATTSVSNVTPPMVDLAVTVSSSADEADPDTDVTYTITITNNGPDTAEDVTWSDPLPGGLTFQRLTQESGPTFSSSTPDVGSNDLITSTIEALLAGESATFTLVAHVPPDAAPGTSYTNIVSVSTTGSIDVLDENNSGPATTFVSGLAQVDLGITLEAPERATIDTDITYTITVRNGGPDDAASVTVTDELSGTLTFVSFEQISGPSFTTTTTPAVGAGGIITSTITSLPAGREAVFKVTVHVPADTQKGTDFTHRVVVQTGASHDVNEENDVASAATFAGFPSIVGITTAPLAATYKVGDVIDIEVTFSEAVFVTGSPRLKLETGATDRTADYFGGTGDATLTFRYTVQAGDAAADLDYAGPYAFDLNEGSIRDDTVFDAILTLPEPGSDGLTGSAGAVVVDGVAPRVTGLTASTPDGTYGPGTVITILVNFSEAVTVDAGGGTPTLTLATGGPGRAVNYLNGSGTASLAFAYTVQEGDSAADLDAIGKGALAANGATIRDSAGNDALLTLPPPGGADSLSANTNLAVDGVDPEVVSILRQAPSSDPTNADSLTFRVTFDEAVSHVDVADFEARGTTAAATAVTAVADGVYDVTVSGGDLPGLNGTVSLAFADAQDIADIRGNALQAPSVPSDTFTLDNVPTDTGISERPPAVSNSASAAFAFTAPEAATFELSLDGAAFVPVAAALTLTGLADGDHMVRVRSVDAAGNLDPTPAAFAWRIDTTPPAPPVVLPVGPGGQTQDTTPAIAGTAEAGSLVTVYIDGAPIGTTAADAAGAWTLAPAAALPQGTYSVQASAADALGNVSPPSAAVSFTIDVNDAPSAVSLANPVAEVDEGGRARKVADVVVTDDALGTETLSLVGADAGSFELRGTELWFRGGADFEAKSSYAVQVTATDEDGLAATSATFALAVGDVAEGDRAGNQFRNTLVGSAGDDVLRGRGDNDTLFGLDGDDVLVGGQGKDWLFGGEGADRFVLSFPRHSLPGRDRDVIGDFESGIDTIDLRGMDADPFGAGGNQAFTWVDRGTLDAAFTGRAGELRLDGRRLSGDVDGDSQADFTILVLGSKIAAADVLL
jgi:uncharacterized repeat protein (TIGR02059 family)/uncharacterized repeat protein (TIGR01451 family)